MATLHPSSFTENREDIELAIDAEFGGNLDNEPGPFIPVGKLEREYRVELEGNDVDAVERCLRAQALSGGTEARVTTLHFAEDEELERLSPIEHTVQWIDGAGELADAPAIVERRARKGEWVSLQRLHLPRHFLRAAMRPTTRRELLPFFSARAQLLGAIRSTWLVFRDGDSKYIATLERNVEFLLMSQKLEPQRSIGKLSKGVLTVRMMDSALPSWLEGLVKMGRPYQPLQLMVAAIEIERERIQEFPALDITFEPEGPTEVDVAKTLPTSDPEATQDVRPFV